MSSKALKIHMILTGGTIGSVIDEGVLSLSSRREPESGRQLDIGSIDAVFQNIELTTSRPFSVFSENLTASHWNLLIREIKSLDLRMYDAVFITHGTDTLAYTSNLFALILHGVETPFFFLSADKPLIDSHGKFTETGNGAANLKRAVDMVRDGAEAGVWIPYRNSDGRMYVHRGEKLLQAEAFSDDFYSVKDPAVNRCGRIAGDHGCEAPIRTIPSVSANILAIRPYPNMCYDAFNLSGVDAILHGTYHSFTASDSEGDVHSLIDFAKRSEVAGVPFYMAPVRSAPEKIYLTAKRILDSGYVTPLYDMSFEMAYARLLIGRTDS
jgi:L-asparaginase